MKSTLLASILFALPIAAQAASGYIEGQVGYVSIDDVDTKKYTSIEAGSVSASLDYDPVIGYGFEIGIRDFEQYNVLRVGLAWNRFKAELDSVSIDATGGTEFVPISGLDSEVDVYSANFYYDFPVEMAFKPYLGFGIGVADIEDAEDKEMAVIGLIGGQYEISEGVNLGIKYQYINIDSFEDELGTEYDDASASMISVTLGVNF